MHQVFVYGTLKRGEANHHWLAEARFGGRRRLEGVRLHDLGPYPMAVPAEDAGIVHGELYTVDAAGLAGLDRLEDVPDEYERRRLRLCDGGEAWVYMGRPEQVLGRPLVAYGDWGATPVFSYGASLCPEQLGRHCRGWDGSGLVARLDGWRFGVREIRPGSGENAGTADLHPDPGAHCWGVVHHLSPADRLALERLDGVANGHCRRQVVRVSTPAGECFPVVAHVSGPARSRQGLRVDDVEARRILRAARQWDLPPAWRDHLGATLRH